MITGKLENTIFIQSNIFVQVGGSVFYYEQQPPVPVEKEESSEVNSLAKELSCAQESTMLETKLSSLVWICTSTHSASIVTIIDANNPADILNSFGVCTSHILCIASVPGASPSDYNVLNSVPTTDEGDTGEEVSEDTAEASTEAVVSTYTHVFSLL